MDIPPQTSLPTDQVSMTKKCALADSVSAALNDCKREAATGPNRRIPGNGSARHGDRLEGLIGGSPTGPRIARRVPNRRGTRKAASHRVATAALVWAILVLFSGCATQDPPPRVLRVAAAANLRFAFEEIESALEQKHPEISLEVTYGSSGSFYAQLAKGAPQDVFFSADTRYPMELVRQGAAAAEDVFPYAGGQLVLWTSNRTTLSPDQLELSALAEHRVERIAVANPRLAPYGAAAIEAMRRAGVYDALHDRLVFGENVAQAAHYAHNGAADVAIIAHSVARAPRLRDAGHHRLIEPEMHAPIEQSAVITGRCRDRPAAELLRRFVTGRAGRSILSRHGYAMIESGT